MAGSPLITTARNRSVSSARRLGKRAFRKTDRRFLVEGPTGVTEALAEPGALLELFVTPDATERHADLVGRAEASGVVVHTVLSDVMDELAQTVTPQGLIGVAAHRDVSLEAVVGLQPLLVAVLANVRDPGNAGTVVRVADAAGADAVIFTDASVDPYNPKCVRSSAGSVFHLPFVVGVTAADTVAALRSAGLSVIAAAGASSLALDSADLSHPAAWVFGNEAWGLPEELVALADVSVRVPIHGRAESLNLATAAAVCLYASASAQRAPGGCRGSGG
jgi:TrmH family RNA methyltransferase